MPVYEKFYKPETQQSLPAPASALALGPVGNDTVALIRKCLAALPPDEYDDWREVGMCIHSVMPGEDGFQLWDQWSASSSKYEATELRGKWDSFHENGNGSGRVTLGTLKYRARQAGADIPTDAGYPDLKLPKDEQLSEPSDWPVIEDAAQILDNPPPRPSELIHGVLYARGKLSLSGPSKARKTFFQQHLGICIAAGLPWYGCRTEAGRVLYVNLELNPWSFQDRLRAILFKLNTILKPNTFDVWNLRGQVVTVERLESELKRQVESRQYAAIIFDPLYKLLGLRKENSAEEMGDLLYHLEAIGHSAGAATVVAHHFAKGSAAAKEQTDRASGSGVVARDGDALLTLTPHEEDDCFSLEATLRDFPPLPATVLRWQYPLFDVDESLDPADLKQPKNKRPEVSTEDVLEVVTTTPQTRDVIIEGLKTKTSRGITACKSAFKKAVDAGLLKIESTPRKGTNPFLRYHK